MTPPLDLNTVINAVTLAVVLWHMRALIDVRERVARIEGALEARRVSDQEKNQ